MSGKCNSPGPRHTAALASTTADSADPRLRGAGAAAWRTRWSRPSAVPRSAFPEPCPCTHAAHCWANVSKVLDAKVVPSGMVSSAIVGPGPPPSGHTAAIEFLGEEQLHAWVGPAGHPRRVERHRPVAGSWRALGVGVGPGPNVVEVHALTQGVDAPMSEQRGHPEGLDAVAECVPESVGRDTQLAHSAVLRQAPHPQPTTPDCHAGRAGARKAHSLAPSAS